MRSVRIITENSLNNKYLAVSQCTYIGIIWTDETWIGEFEYETATCDYIFFRKFYRNLNDKR